MPSSHIALPPPLIDGQLSLEAAIAQRCRVSPYIEEQLAAEEIGQLLWAAHTVADVHKGTSGATRLNLYTCRGDGVWRYHPLEHCLTRHLNQDVRDVLSDAAHNRWFIGQAPSVLVISTSPRRIAGEKHGQIQQLRYPPIEAGRAVERVLLQAGALGLASVPVSEFDSERVRHALILSRQEEPMYLLPVGWPAQSD
jgi:SagB-type dehydrogenase family enzyme